MNTIAGKPLALALVLALGLLAALLAVGVFTPRGAQAQVSGHDVTLSTSDAGAAVEITIAFTTTALTEAPVGDNILLKLEDFGLPSAIGINTVWLRDATPRSARPADVSVSGSTVTINIGDMDSGPDQGGIAIGAAEVIISRNAGITNPTRAGAYTPKVTIGSSDTEMDSDTVANIVRTLKISPNNAKRGTEINVSGVGYEDGTIGIYKAANGTSGLSNDGDKGELNRSLYSRLAGSEVANGAFSVSFNVDHEKFTDSNNFSGDPDIIQAHDASGYYGPQKVFNLLPTMPPLGEVTRGKDLTIKLQDWGYGPVGMVEISGARMTPVGDLPATNSAANASAGFKVTVGQNAQLGKQTVTVTAQESRDSVENEGNGVVTGTVDIVSLDLTVQPSTAVVGQAITVTGDGFTNGNSIATITIGGVNIPLGPNNIDPEIAAGGSVIATFDVPDNSDLAGADDYTIQITDGAGRAGTVDLTIPKRAVSISPTTSRIGSEVTVNCTGFPTGASVPVTIKYDTGTVTSTRTDSSGNCIERVIDVPADAGVGSTHKVRLEATVGGENGTVISAETDHRTPDAEVTLSAPEASRGSRITVSGANFHTFRPVRIDIGDSNVTPSPSPDTDRDGAFSASVLVPGIALGPRNVKVTINDEVVVVSMRITEAPVIQTPASVFASIIAEDALEVVWYYDNETETWSFYDPDPAFAAASDLTEIGQGLSSYSVQLSKEVTFNGQTYTAGWKTIILNR